MQPDISYQLTFSDSREERIVLMLDPQSGEIVCHDDYTPPDWAMLGHNQCSHCPLRPDEVTYCPIARNIAHLFSGNNTGSSHDRVALRVEMGQRIYLFETSAQRALSSLFGLICALSPCPHTQPLKPMGIMHLPLASDVETLVRISSLFLLRSYLAHQDNPAVPVDLSEMESTYQNLTTLNKGMASRLREASASDTAVNAITLLDVLVKDVRFELDSQLKLLRELMNI
ncbi:MAG: hypothetical protein V2I38_11455 [Alcanivoracaceae bacterium]|jgi:hypothetical protein|nr:hypothetical protein [Alcanivoracaceae bacterium]